MKVIIAGSRNIDDAHAVVVALTGSGWMDEMTEVVSGGARGVDAWGEAVARCASLPCRVFPADWTKHGKAAGPIRNAEMAAYADALVAVWDGRSRGTANMIDTMRRLGKPVHVHLI